MQCISRRACSNRDSFKLYRTDGEILKEGRTIWTEYRCQNLAIEGKHVCNKCSAQIPKHREQSAPKCNHGIIGGAYTEDSKLYGSPYYLQCIKKGWKIKDDDERRAKEAQLLTNMAKKPLIETSPISTGSISTSPATTPTVPDKIKKPRKPRVAKKATELISKNLEPIINASAQFVESLALPITIEDCNTIVVKLRKIRCEGKEFYYDKTSGKLYGVLTNGVGPYKGRYNTESETIDTSYPDSDQE